MKKYTCFIFYFFWMTYLFAQTDCEVEDCRCILQKANDAFFNRKYEDAVPLFQAYKVCQTDRAAFADSMVLQVFKAIEKEKRRAYANDLAYKSQIALRNGDRTTAFRLAELAYRFTEKDNPILSQSLIDAYYYNDNPMNTPLPWSIGLYVDTLGYLNAGPLTTSHDGRFMAAAFGEGAFVVLNMKTGKTDTIYGYEKTEQISCIDFSKDNKQIVTVTEKGHIKVWDLNTNRELIEFKFASDGYAYTTFSNKNNVLASWADGSNTIILWDLILAEETAQIKCIEGIGFRVIFSPDDTKFAIALSDHSIALIDIQLDSVIHTFKNHQSDIYGLAFSPDGRSLVSTSFDREVIVWDIESRNIKYQFRTDGLPAFPIFSASGDTFTVVGMDGVRAFDISKTRESKHRSTDSYLGAESPILSIYPDSNQVVVGGLYYFRTPLVVWNYGTNNLSKIESEDFRRVYCVAHSPDGRKVIAGSSDSTATIWDLVTRRPIFRLTGHSDYINCVAYSPAENYVATGSGDSTAIVWNLATNEMAWKMVERTGPIIALNFSPDGSKVAICSDNEKKVKIWNTLTGKLEFSFEGHEDYVSSIVFSPNGKLIISGDEDGILKLWDANTGVEMKTIETLKGKCRFTTGIFFSGNEKVICVVESLPIRSICVLDIKSGEILMTLNAHSKDIISLSASTNGETVATGIKGEIAIWDISIDTILLKASRYRLAALSKEKLIAYRLENLLDANPNNEQVLIQTMDCNQIAAFADLYADKIAKSLPKKEDYERAKRLYLACLESGVDNGYFEKKMAELEKVWKERGE